MGIYVPRGRASAPPRCIASPHDRKESVPTGAGERGSGHGHSLGETDSY